MEQDMEDDVGEEQGQAGDGNRRRSAGRPKTTSSAEQETAIANILRGNANSGPARDILSDHHDSERAASGIVAWLHDKGCIAAIKNVAQPAAASSAVAKLLMNHDWCRAYTNNLPPNVQNAFMGRLQTLISSRLRKPIASLPNPVGSAEEQQVEVGQSRGPVIGERFASAVLDSRAIHRIRSSDTFERDISVFAPRNGSVRFSSLSTKRLSDRMDHMWWSVQAIKRHSLQLPRLYWAELASDRRLLLIALAAAHDIHDISFSTMSWSLVAAAARVVVSASLHEGATPIPSAVAQCIHALLDAVGTGTNDMMNAKRKVSDPVIAANAQLQLLKHGIKNMETYSGTFLDCALKVLALTACDKKQAVSFFEFINDAPLTLLTALGDALSAGYFAGKDAVDVDAPMPKKQRTDGNVLPPDAPCRHGVAAAAAVALIASAQQEFLVSSLGAAVEMHIPPTSGRSRSSQRKAEVAMQLASRCVEAVNWLITIAFPQAVGSSRIASHVPPDVLFRPRDPEGLIDLCLKLHEGK